MSNIIHSAQVEYPRLRAEFRMAWSRLNYLLWKFCFTCRQEASDKELTVVLLADSKLLQLPLEALKFLQVDNVCSVARDFSLQMFYYRITKFLPKESGK